MKQAGSTPKTTDKPSDTGAGARTDREAKFTVASKPGTDGHAPVDSGKPEPDAPDPTSDRPERGPSGAATQTKFIKDKTEKR